MIRVPRRLLRELEQTIDELEEKGIEAENAAAQLSRAMGDVLTTVAERSRLAHKAHRLLREMEAVGVADAAAETAAVSRCGPRQSRPDRQERR